MKQLLDREMPVAAQRRPAAWFWWAAATAGLAGLFAALLYAGPSASAPELGQLPVILKGDIATSRPAHSGKADAPTNESVMALTAVKDGSGLTPLPPAAGAAAHRSASPLQQSAAVASAPSQRPQPAHPDGNQLEVQPDRPAPAPLPRLDQLPTRPGTIVVQKTSSEKMQASNSTIQPAVWRAGLTGGGWADLASGALGYEGGLFLAFHPHHSPWYGRATATYQSSAQRRTLSQQSFMYTIAEAAGTASASDAYLLTAATHARDFHWATLSLHTGYNILPRLGLEAGLFGSYLAAARQTNSWALPPDQNTPSNQDQFETNIAGRYQNTSYTSRAGLSQWQGGWSVGLKYNYSTSTFVTLQYRSGWSDILESPGFAWQPRSFSLSLFHGL